MYSITQKTIDWLRTKRPKYEAGSWYFQCAYADCKDEYFVLPDYAFNVIKSEFTTESHKSWHGSPATVLYTLHIWLDKMQKHLDALKID